MSDSDAGHNSAEAILYGGAVPRGTSPHFSQVCTSDRANPMSARTSVAISDVVGRQAVNISRTGLRCSGNDLRPAVRLTVRNPGEASHTAAASGSAWSAVCRVRTWRVATTATTRLPLRHRQSKDDEEDKDIPVLRS